MVGDSGGNPNLLLDSLPWEPSSSQRSLSLSAWDPKIAGLFWLNNFLTIFSSALGIPTYPKPEVLVMFCYHHFNLLFFPLMAVAGLYHGCIYR